MTVKEARLFIRNQLKEAGVPDFEIDSDILIMEALSLSREGLFLDAEKDIPSDKQEKLMDYCEKRKERIPLQHILGTTCFMGFDFKVNENVLIPRSDTEILVENAVKYIEKCKKTPIQALDMFTGSGCVATSIAKIVGEKCQMTAVDVSKNALEVARENAKNNHVNIRFMQGDVYLAIPKDARFDIITANPPYIRKEDIKSLQPEVRIYDPIIALDGGEDGLFFYRKLAQDLESHLAFGGRFLTEISFDQAQDVSDIFEEYGFCCERIIKDYAKDDRVLVFCRR